MRPPRALPVRLRSVLAGPVLCAVLVTAGAIVPARATAGTETVRFTATTVPVQWRGNGHGHGMSQYGAQGAALQGLTAPQILSFYYPGTNLQATRASHIRVRLTNGMRPLTTVLSSTPGLALSGVGALPTARYAAFRLVPDGSGLALEGRPSLAPSSPWRALRAGLPARADFSGSGHWVQVQLADRSSTRYRGLVSAVRSGAGEITVNRLFLDQYVKGSVPREVPSSWEPAAVQAQAVAARSYAETARATAGSDSLYDICDNTMCQMYGGMAHYASDGTLLWSEFAPAVAGNERTVLRYQGAPVLAQYSASDGGATTDGGLPYLVGRPDPYDGAASGDPYLDQSGTASVASLAASYGLRTVTAVRVTRRDGNGPWGGRVVTAVVVGTDRSGAAARVPTTGSALGSALGVWTDYLRLTG